MLRLSGFDAFWGPQQFLDHLGDKNLRRIIKANSLTFNIDNPEWGVGDPRRINDTKRYLPAVGTAFEIHERVFTSTFEQHLRAKLRAKRPYVDFPGTRLSPEFTQGLMSLERRAPSPVASWPGTLASTRRTGPRPSRGFAGSSDATQQRFASLRSWPAGSR